MRISAFFAPVRDTPDHIRLAEDLGFDTAWVYDSPLLYVDPFITLARAAERTSRIRLGVGVLVPGFRAPVATVAAIRSISQLAPGRVRIAVGAGFTGRFTLGLGPVSIARLEGEVHSLRALLAGEEVRHAEGGRMVRDIPVPGAEGGGEVEILVSCRAPHAQAVARAGDGGAMSGIFYPGGLATLVQALGPDTPLTVHAVAAVTADDEAIDSPRMRAAAGPVVAVAFHAFAEQPWRLDGVDPALRVLGEEYIAAIGRSIPGNRRHQELHRGHLVELVRDEDRAVVTPDTIRRFAFAGTAADLADRARGLASDGVAELALQPGDDVENGLRRLASALIRDSA